MDIFKRKIFWGIIAVGAAAFLFFFLSDRIPTVSQPKPTKLPESLNFLNIPENFAISVYTKDLENPRVMAFDQKGRMFVSETKAGRISIIEGEDNDGIAEKKTVLIDGLNLPHGIDFYTQELKDKRGKKTGEKHFIYIAEIHQVTRREYDLENKKVLGSPEQIAAFSPEGRHFTRTIAFGPNLRRGSLIKELILRGESVKNRLYISVGSSCDVCIEESWKKAAILESDPAGSFTAEFAGGLRNSVFFTFHPLTGEMWATEMGRDNLGDNLPPDEVNIVKPDKKYGWPYCYGKQISDKKFKPPRKIERTDIPENCSQTEPSKIDIPAHSAPLGLTFITSKKWPVDWQNHLLVAYHGSWNSSVPTGYKIVIFKLNEKGDFLGVEDFITGWLAPDNKVSGRPVDLKFQGDNLFITDDQSGVIYKVEPW